MARPTLDDQDGDGIPRLIDRDDSPNITENDQDGDGIPRFVDRDDRMPYWVQGPPAPYGTPPADEVAPSPPSGGSGGSDGGGGGSGWHANPVPAGTTDDGVYTVAAGDTLAVIARANNTTVAELVRINGIADPNRISVGQQIKLTAGPAGPQPTAEDYAAAQIFGRALSPEEVAEMQRAAEAARGIVDNTPAPTPILDPTTGRPAWSGPNGEGGTADRAGMEAWAREHGKDPSLVTSYEMPDGRTAWYIPNESISQGNVAALSSAPATLIDPTTGRAAFTGPGGEGGTADRAGMEAWARANGQDPSKVTMYTMPDGRNAWYIPGVAVSAGNQAALALNGLTGGASPGQTSTTPVPSGSVALVEPGTGINTGTGRAAWSGPNGEGGTADRAGMEAWARANGHDPSQVTSFVMPNGRTAWYIPNVAIDGGNRAALGLPPTTGSPEDPPIVAQPGTPSAPPVTSTSSQTTLIDPTTGRPAWTGPNGEGATADRAGMEAWAREHGKDPSLVTSYEMPDGRTAWYIPNEAISQGNQAALSGTGGGSTTTTTVTTNTTTTADTSTSGADAPPAADTLAASVTNTVTGRAAWTGPNGEGATADRAGMISWAIEHGKNPKDVTSYEMPDGRTAWYIPGEAITAGNQGALAAAGVTATAPITTSDLPRPADMTKPAKEEKPAPTQTYTAKEQAAINAWGSQLEANKAKQDYEALQARKASGGRVTQAELDQAAANTWNTQVKANQARDTHQGMGGAAGANGSNKSLPITYSAPKSPRGNGF